MSINPHLKSLIRVPSGQPTSPDFSFLDFSEIKNVSYLRGTHKSWFYWCERYAQHPPLFNWVAIFNFHPGADRITFSLDAGTRVAAAEALMLVTVGHVVRCDGGARPPLVYVNFLEVAPWNRQGVPERRHVGLGPIMLRLASDLSIQRGFGGRLGLHSVASAEGFYDQMGFRRLDCPSEHIELYFEMDERHAEVLLSE